jgi:hypothetical protein
MVGLVEGVGPTWRTAGTEEAIMNEGTVSGVTETGESAAQSTARKFGLFFCGTCILGWTALGVAVVAVTLAKVLGYI